MVNLEIKMNLQLLRKIQQFAQCNPKKRGRPVKAENIKNPKREANKGNLCEQKRVRDGEIIYYNTSKGKARKSNSLSRLKTHKKKLREDKKRMRAKSLAIASDKNLKTEKIKSGNLKIEKLRKLKKRMKFKKLKGGEARKKKW